MASATTRATHLWATKALQILLGCLTLLPAACLLIIWFVTYTVWGERSDTKSLKRVLPTTVLETDGLHSIIDFHSCASIVEQEPLSN